MFICDLINLASQHPIILYVGDIDYESVIPIASHIINLSNHKMPNFFNI